MAEDIFNGRKYIIKYAVIFSVQGVATTGTGKENSKYFLMYREIKLNFCIFVLLMLEDDI